MIDEKKKIITIILRMRINFYFPASDQNFVISIRFSDPDFFKRDTIIIWRADDVSRCDLNL